MPSKRAPSIAAIPLSQALRESAPLARLGERLRLSNSLFAAIVPALPAGLSNQVSAGPVDDEGWSLLCNNASVAAKLRQLVPHLQQRLLDAGQPVAAIRVKVQPR